MEFVIPRETHQHQLRCDSPGNGKAWFSDLEVEIDGQKYSTDRFDLSLASWPPRGFLRRRERVRVIRTTPSSATAGDPAFRQVSASPKHHGRFRQQVPQQDGGRFTSISDRPRVRPPKDDGQFRNARLCCRRCSRAHGEVTRDQSMADNIKWILEKTRTRRSCCGRTTDTSPEAADRVGTYRPMGASLL